MVYLLERLKLAELLGENCNVVPNNVHIGMPSHLIATGLLCLRDLIVLIAAPSTFDIVLFLLGSVVVVGVGLSLAFDRRHHFPLLLEGAFTHQLVLRI